MGKRHGEATAQGECLGRHIFLKKFVTISSRNRESSLWQDNYSTPEFFLVDFFHSVKLIWLFQGARVHNRAQIPAEACFNQERAARDVCQVLVCPCYTLRNPSWSCYLQPSDDDFPFKLHDG